MRPRVQMWCWQCCGENISSVIMTPSSHVTVTCYMSGWRHEVCSGSTGDGRAGTIWGPVLTSVQHHPGKHNVMSVSVGQVSLFGPCSKDGRWCRCAHEMVTSAVVWAVVWACRWQVAGQHRWRWCQSVETPPVSSTSLHKLQQPYKQVTTELHSGDTAPSLSW